MKRLIAVALACLAFEVAVAQITSGSCPTVKPIANFDISKFKGKWFEVSKTVALGDGKCVSVTFQSTANNLTLTLSFTDKDGKTVSFTGPAVLTSTPGVWTVNFPGPQGIISTSYIIMDTDYTTFASIFACGAAGDDSFQIGFGLARKLPLTSKVTTSINGAFTKSKLSTPSVSTIQAGCN